MTGALAAAADQLQAAIANLAASGSPDVAACRAKLAEIVALKQGVAVASPASLATLSGQIAAVADAAKSSAQEALTQANGGSAQMNQLTTAQATARAAVGVVMAGMKDFDPYLKFASPGDEAEYREREKQRQEQIAREQAKQTPEGDLNAITIAKDQMADAGVHGAARSPEFASRNQALDDAGATLAASMDRDAPKRAATSQTPSQHDADLADAMAALTAAGVKGPPADKPEVTHGLQADGSPSTVRLR